MSVFVTGLTVPRMRKRLSDYAEGDIVRLNEGGTIADFYVACHNYESGLNGTGRTLLVRKDCFREDEWDKMTTENQYKSHNAYGSSSIDAWLNDAYNSLLVLGSNVDIPTTTFYYTHGNDELSGVNDMTVSTLTRKVFLLSVTELGKEKSGQCNVEGSALPTASLLEYALLDGSKCSYWTRSPRTDNSQVLLIRNTDGAVAYETPTLSKGVRPALTLPSNTRFDEETSEFVGVPA